jgi:eukaryotic-like serine/threonine-protein kinase
MQGGFVPKIGIRKGDVIDGKYRVDWVLGTGSTGVVLAAFHLTLHERVAIKLLLPEALSNPEAVQRFEREARAAVKIKSEHVARVIDVGSLPEGAPYIVMEHLQGEDLAARLARTGALPIEEAVDFVLQACEAIAEAHGLGIVHRDLKPANLFCVRGSDGHATIKVLDFGISKILDNAGLHASGEMTRTSVVVGSPFYMSPEQMQAPRTVDARTDIWSIGVILYELIAGSVPFPGETLPQIAVRVSKSPPPMLRVIRSEVPAGLESVIERCLEKNAKKRYKSVAELAAALGRFGARKALSSVDRIRLNFKNASERPFSISLPPEGELAQQASAGTSPPWGAATTRDGDKRSRRHTATAMLATAAALGSIGAWLMIVGSSEQRPAAAPAFASQPPPKSGIADDDPTRAYAVTPGASVLALPPPTGTGQAALPRARPNDPHPSRAALPRPPVVEGAADRVPTPVPSLAAPRAPSAKTEGTCLLRLSSTPSSTVVLDGNTLGPSPRPISVWAGSHTLVFRSTDGQAKKTTVTCAPGETKTIDVKLGDLPPAEGSPADPCPLCDRP